MANGVATISSLIADDGVEFAELHRRYAAQLELVRRLIGVVPNCDPFLEIWPTAFRSYNLMVPNFLNLPALLFGAGAPKETVGLAMYVASRTAECAYCSAHTCSFAMRRGARPEKVVSAFGKTLDLSGHTDADRAAIAAAEHLSSIPATFSRADLDELKRHFSSSQAEWLALAVAMMGFLNKFMDSAGVPLEESSVSEVEPLIGESGWSPKHHLDHEVAPGAAPPSDSVRSVLGVLRHAPRAVMLERRWMAGVPGKWPALGSYMRERTGHDFPLLGRISHTRPRRALATMLRDNLVSRDSVLGLKTKALAGLVYAGVVEDATLAEQARQLAKIAGVPDVTISHVGELGTDLAGFETAEEVRGAEVRLRSSEAIDANDAVALILAKACSPSPAAVTRPVLTRVGEELSAAAIIELLTWISIQQLLHRLNSFFAAS